MLAFKEPAGPLNYRQVEELIAWITASSDVTFEYAPESHGEAAAEAVEPVVGDRLARPELAAGARRHAAAGLLAQPQRRHRRLRARGHRHRRPTAPVASPEPITGGTADAPRVIKLAGHRGPALQGRGRQRGVRRSTSSKGETIQFEVDNTAGFDHNFYIGTPDELAVPNGTTDTGIPTWQSGVQTLTWTATGDGLQFACTVPGHYSTMHGAIVIQG